MSDSPRKKIALGDGISLVERDGKLQMTADTEEHPFFSPEGRSHIHEGGVDAHVYGLFLDALRDPSGILKGSALGYVADVLGAMKPRDAMERMMVTHALWCHGRIAKLNILLAVTTKVSEVKILSELVDRASNDFRKSMLALAEYRRPRRAPKIIGQLNTAHQQVVQNNGGRNATKRVAVRSQKALPPAPNQPRRSRVSEAKNSRGKAVARVDRATNRRG